MAVEFCRRYSAPVTRVDVTQSGGLGQNSTVSVRGTDAKHLLVLIDGVRLNNAGISGQPDLNQFGGTGTAG